MKNLPILHYFFSIITFLPQNYCNLLISQSNCFKLVLDLCTVKNCWNLKLKISLDGITKQLCLDLWKTILSATRISRKDGFWSINQSDCRKLKVSYLENERNKYKSNTIFFNNFLLPFQWKDQTFALEAF